jgi:PPOX class probable F420-dependent enzyme
MTQTEMESFLEQPRVAVFSTMRPDGTIHSTPVWFEYAQGRFYFWVDSHSAKAKDIEFRAEASVCIATHEEPYRYVSVEGAVEVLVGDIAKRCLSICRRYYDEERARTFVEEDLQRGDGALLVLTPRTLLTEASA